MPIKRYDAAAGAKVKSCPVIYCLKTLACSHVSCPVHVQYFSLHFLLLALRALLG